MSFSTFGCILLQFLLRMGEKENKFFKLDNSFSIFGSLKRQSTVEENHRTPNIFFSISGAIPYSFVRYRYRTD